MQAKDLSSCACLLSLLPLFRRNPHNMRIADFDESCICDVASLPLRKWLVAN